ncbi:hypothetical protein J2Z76_001489 [Sedimentibacter acidaminivorans]|uniref:Shikimate kinase n=1 Tax=Sedimentibacter acidaminivorans TaxID=913099 RepID=A0ABS4GD46_9FIRM|nr:hypothetical protein [Sedimentibacter acidaminivorans]MBP1925630.1 hypothetical protein [Sedimentibacter acidaminivorans]
MKLVFLIGDAAVGKMTVGQELMKITGLRLFHKRNITENRLKHKASKQDIENSNQRLINDDRKYRCVSNDDEIQFENYIKIDNSNLSPELVAKMIKECFNL